MQSDEAIVMAEEKFKKDLGILVRFEYLVSNLFLNRKIENTMWSSGYDTDTAKQISQVRVLPRNAGFFKCFICSFSPMVK